MATTTVQITPTRCIFNAGQFDSDFRYIRRTASGVRSTMLAGPSFAVARASGSSVFSWRFGCGTYSVYGQSDNAAAPPSSVSNTASRIAL